MKIAVCQKMFLNSLGYTSNQKIVTLFENNEASDITVRDDQRGKRDPPNKKDADIHAKVKEHIFSYHPSVSHYRRKHARTHTWIHTWWPCIRTSTKNTQN